MQLGSPGVRGRLGAAVCLVLGPGAVTARATTSTAWRFDGSGLLYGGSGRAVVLEPMARIARVFPDGQNLSLTLGIDAVTGSSPTGAIPTTTVQTTTTPSGRVKTSTVGTVPTNAFRDARGSLDLAWEKPFREGLTTSLGTHVSKEKDYRSLGAHGKVSLALMHRLTTVTVGGGYNQDEVSPTGGTRAPFTDGTVITGTDPNPKYVTSALLGVSRVLTRRWMVGLDASRSYERGYLTEPYKVISLVDPDSGDPVGELTEKRPPTRDRRDVLGSSVYHFETDLLYVSDRYYWDDWGIRSNTVDFKYRHELVRDRYFEPHVRYYVQTGADFFRYSLTDGGTLPDFASSDFRLGPLQSFTIGGTYGFQVPGRPGEWRVRAEYLRQWGKAHPQEVIGSQRATDLSAPVEGASVAVLYSLEF